MRELKKLNWYCKLKQNSQKKIRKMMSKKLDFKKSKNLKIFFHNW